MHEITTIVFTGLCLFVRPEPANNSFTAYLIVHEKQTSGFYKDIPSHKAFIKVRPDDVDDSAPSGLRFNLTDPGKLYRVYYIDAGTVISISGADDELDTSFPIAGYERPFGDLPHFSAICPKDECGGFVYPTKDTVRVTVNRGHMYVGTEGIKSSEWKFCTENGPPDCSKTFSIKDDILPQRVGVRLDPKRSIKICTAADCPDATSISIKKGGHVLIGSGDPDEINTDCFKAPTTPGPPKTDPHFKLYYKLREKQKGYVPFNPDAKSHSMRSIFDMRNWPEGSDCPPLQY